MKKQERHIGFPPSLWGEAAARLPVLFFESERSLLALDKIPGVVSDAHPWYQELPSVVKGIRDQLKMEKPELMAYGLKEVQSVYFLEAEISGVMLLATEKKALEDLRNQLGSGRMSFVFHFLARRIEGGAEGSAFECRLPLANHFYEPRSIVSHKTGKKCATRFTRLEELGKYELWEARSEYCRPHQIRLHALESGLRIVGEQLYGEEPLIYLSHFKKRFNKKQEEAPLYGSLCLHLQQLVCAEGVSVESPLPRGFSVLLKKLRALS